MRSPTTPNFKGKRVINILPQPRQIFEFAASLGSDVVEDPVVVLKCAFRVNLERNQYFSIRLNVQLLDGEDTEPIKHHYEFLAISE